MSVLREKPRRGTDAPPQPAGMPALLDVTMRRKLIIVFTAVLVVLAILAAWLRLGPIPSDLLDPARFASMTVVDRNGEVLYEPLSPRGNRAEWLRAADVPPRVAEATIAAEDRRFYRHVGIDPIAVARAMLHNVKHLRVVEGGSTISQQVAKLLLDPGDAAPGVAAHATQHRRGIVEKVREAVLALRLEHRYPKQEILALYLNLAPYGNQTAGLGRASKRYFGCSPESLTAAQAAFLASLPQRPSAFDPLRDPRRAQSRQRAVLVRMQAMGFLTAAQLAEARAERLRFDHGSQPFIAPHFVEFVLSQLGDSRPRRVVTTLDASLQREVEGIIAAERDDLLRHGAHSVAVVVLDNTSGEWLAWEGSGDYFGAGFGGAIDGVTTMRQPGSTLKPFTYALGFEQGFSPATVLADVPSNFPTAEEGVVYAPRNYDGRYRGPLRARMALAGSENVPAVAMLSKIGAPALLRLLRHAGFHGFTKTADFYGLGLTLGDAEVRLDQLVSGYAMLARGGLAVTPRTLRETGSAPADATRIVSPRTAFWITDILSDPSAREYIFGRGGNLEFPFPVAVKTGTSQAYRDNWTLGYTREVTVGVWVGNFDRAVLRNSTGVTGAGPIFHSVMLAAMHRARGGLPLYDDRPIVEPPPDLERVEICALSGLRPSNACPNVETEWIPRSEVPRFCSWHHNLGDRVAIDWPAEYRAWARSAGLLRDPQLAASDNSARRRTANKADAIMPLHVVNPPQGATYLIDPTLRMQYQTLRLRASTDQRTRLTWRVDAHQVGECSSDASVDWPLAPGRHTIAAVDGRGHRDEVTITVK
ncbi:MAG TPA: penicillin-binding protein 1C [Thermoanaerobaculia bacterium]|nr:penicillin-binding protein 1C [Thermoanaerobaculia bacterium]